MYILYVIHVKFVCIFEFTVLLICIGFYLANVMSVIVDIFLIQ